MGQYSPAPRNAWNHICSPHAPEAAQVSQAGALHSIRSVYVSQSSMNAVDKVLAILLQYQLYQRQEVATLDEATSQFKMFSVALRRQVEFC